MYFGDFVVLVRYNSNKIHYITYGTNQRQVQRYTRLTRVQDVFSTRVIRVAIRVRKTKFV